jgi:hypothetical protein
LEQGFSLTLSGKMHNRGKGFYGARNSESVFNEKAGFASLCTLRSFVINFANVPQVHVRGGGPPKRPTIERVPELGDRIVEAARMWKSF